MSHNNTNLTPLEIERVRKAIEHYAQEHTGPAKYVVIEGLDKQEKHYDYTAVCLIYFDGGCELHKDGLREEGHVLGINRMDDGGFEVPID